MQGGETVVVTADTGWVEASGGMVKDTGIEASVASSSGHGVDGVDPPLVVVCVEDCEVVVAGFTVDEPDVLTGTEASVTLVSSMHGVEEVDAPLLVVSVVDLDDVVVVAVDVLTGTEASVTLVSSIHGVEEADVLLLVISVVD